MFYAALFVDAAHSAAMSTPHRNILAIIVPPVKTTLLPAYSFAVSQGIKYTA
jgi:hypothetical protein